MAGISLMEYVMFYVLFPGGILFWFAEQCYFLFFDLLFRQESLPKKVKRLLLTGYRWMGFGERDEGNGGDGNSSALNNGRKLVDWENPRVVGRRRRPMHTNTNSFSTRAEALRYWRARTNDPELPPSDDSKSIHYLTGLAGEPDPNDIANLWQFQLVGKPEDAPVGWEKMDDADAGDNFEGGERNNEGGSGKANKLKSGKGHAEWASIALPNHWQLQGYDVPMYTNTSYPFEYNPPYVRRTGKWVNQLCDLGLGGSPETSAPLHALEPGENATGLYRRKFRLPEIWTAAAPSNPSPMGISSITSRIFLVFEGVDSAFSVWINGRFVGYSQDSCLTVEFDVSDVLNRDESRHELNGSPLSLEENVIAVKVMRWCDGSYIEDQDKWWLSGIYREAYLVRRPYSFIADYEFTSDLVSITGSSEEGKSGKMKPSSPSPLPSAAVSAALEAFGDGGRGGGDTGEESRWETLSAKVSLAAIAEGVLTYPNGPEDDGKGGESDSRRGGMLHHIRAEFWSPLLTEKDPALVLTGVFKEGKIIASKLAADKVYIDGDSADWNAPARIRPGIATVQGFIKNPLLWTAETPYLYTLILSLHASESDAISGAREIHVESRRVGIRKVAIGGPANQLCVNDVPIIIAGVNRHEFDSRFGRAVSYNSMRRDAKLLKQWNFNAVRNSHYPVHPYWYQLCDEIGLYVVDEANIESHGFQALGQPVGFFPTKREWRGALAARVTRMYEREKNAACVIGWSLGNESGYGPAFKDCANWLRLRDPTRFVQYESGGARTLATDVICPMYMRPSWCLDKIAVDKTCRPVILCEYAHAMGNSGGSLADYWSYFLDMEKYPRMQGGFIWDLVDQALRLPEKPGVPVNTAALTTPPRFAYGGDFGELPNTKEFCINGLIAPDRTPYGSIFEVKTLQAPVHLSLEVAALGSAAGSGDVTARKVFVHVKSRRFHSDTSDLTMHFSLCASNSRVPGSHTKFAFFSIPCGTIAAGDTAVFDITEELLRSLRKDPLLLCNGTISTDISTATGDGAGSVESSVGGGVVRASGEDISRDLSCWIDVSVMKAGLVSAASEKIARSSSLSTSSSATFGGASAYAATPSALPSGKFAPPPPKPSVSRSGLGLGFGISEGDHEEGGEVEMEDDHGVGFGGLQSKAVETAEGEKEKKKDQPVVELPLTTAAQAQWYKHGQEVLHTALTGGGAAAGSEGTAVERGSGRGSGSGLSGERDSAALTRFVVETVATMKSAAGSDSVAEKEAGEGDRSLVLPWGTALAFPASVASAETEKFTLSTDIEDSSADLLTVRWSNGAQAVVGKHCGRILSWTDAAGNQVIAAPIDLCLHRAGTNNDRGGMQFGYYHSWASSGTASLTRTTTHVVGRKREEGGGEDEGKGGDVNGVRKCDIDAVTGNLSVHTEWCLCTTTAATAENKNNNSKSSNKKKTKKGLFLCRAEYTFCVDGSVEADLAVTLPTAAELPGVPTLPRVGIRFALPSTISCVQWLGRGPHEAYEDRKSGAYFGVFRAELPALHTPYVFPQENGRRADPRWIQFQEKSSPAGLAVVTDTRLSPSSPTSTADDSTRPRGEGWGFSASAFSMEALEHTTHNHDLRADEDCKVHVHIDSRHMGLGGYDSWSPNVLEKHLIQPNGQTVHTAVRLIPLSLKV